LDVGECDSKWAHLASSSVACVIALSRDLHFSTRQLEQQRLADARRHLQTISAQWETLGRVKGFVER
jgi:hypothetical protein